ncbi:MAG: multiheme c-type cytochrome, partial [Nitrospinota bacterium]
TLKQNASSTIQSFEEEQILLSPDIKDSPDIAPLFEAYNREVAAFFEKKNREKKQEKGIFLGVANCKTCHEYFWGKWKETPHSWAWDTLVKREKTSDPDCVPCHTVGYDQPGGFISINKTPDLVDVQCEVCHGPGGSHAANFSKRLPPVNEKTCLQCHNEKHSPDFNYQDYFRQITH